MRSDPRWSGKPLSCDGATAVGLDLASSRIGWFRVAALLLTAGGAAFAQDGTPVQPRSFAYVLQAENLGATRQDAVRRLADCGRDWIVVDPAFEAGENGDWSASDIATIRAGRPGRRVLAYLSIGEAEDYRPYWRRPWDADRDGKPDLGAPVWLCGENPDWKGNYKVRYWHPAWQATMLARLAAVVRAGFDGVYLDLVDAFEFFEYDAARKDWIDDRPNPETAQTYREDMVGWVRRMAAEARRERPGFLVVPQNGSQLLANPEYRATVDAIGVEDLFTLGNRIQKRDHTDQVLGFLGVLKATGKPVLVIEYGTKPEVVRLSFQRAETNGLVLLVTDRELKTLGRSERGAADLRR